MSFYEKIKNNLPFRYVIRIIALVLFVILLIRIIPPTDAISINPLKKNNSKMNVVASSGSGRYNPPNTMLSFNTAASSYGIMTFSIGVVMSTDGKLIVADYDDLSVYTDKTGKISEMTYEELSKLNFAYNFTTDGGATYQYRTQLVQCIDIYALFKAYPYVNYIINVIQQNDPGIRAVIALCEAIRSCDMSLKVAIKGSNEVVKAAREETNVHIMTPPIRHEINSYMDFERLGLDHIYIWLNFQYIEIPANMLGKYSPRVLAKLQTRNVAIYVSGVDDDESYKKAVAIKADGVITNDPELIVQLIETDASDIQNEP
ncbi:MAG: hypothetical protein IK026_06625 [Eubacteriaceae bacterium]|nr:hypothetical protein [Eubacteriaceae bacterium]